MDKLIREAKKSTPKVTCDSEENYILIKGESYPENSFEFYEPIMDWVEEYIEELDDQKTTVELSLSYLNTSSTKSVMCILDILEEGYQEGKDITINWYYDKDNELSYEMAEDFMDYLEIPFKLHVREEE
jgi:hypothetical protein